MAADHRPRPVLAVLAVVALAVGLVVAWSGGLLDPSASALAHPADGPVTRQAARPPTPAERYAVVLDRLERAGADAAADGVVLEVTSGLRDAAEQEALVEEALATHGDVEGRRWALPPEQSAHVLGTAVDVAGESAREWLARRGAEYGFCLVYDNEPWHFELLVDPGGTCPPTRPDASVDWPDAG